MAHVVDLARFLNGELATVHGFTHTFLPGRAGRRRGRSGGEFENGSVGTLEATRFAHGRRNALQWEINGTKGSLAFDMERMNELQVFRADGDRARGFKTVLVSETDHPFWEHWWPPGHIIGWGDTFVHELHHLLEAIAKDTPVAPYGATFEDGYRAAEICDAIVRSGASGVARDDRVPIMSPTAGTYVVFQQFGENDWRVIGEIRRRPGLPARKSRAQAIRDVLGREPFTNETFAVLQRSEWRIASTAERS